MVRKQPKRKPCSGVDEYGRTPLHNAVIAGDLFEVRKALDEGAEVNTCDDDGWTPLHFASQDHMHSIAMLLIQKGGAINSQDSNGNTPLFRAVMNAYRGDDFIAFLKNHGADPDIKNKYDISPRDVEQYAS